MVTERDSIQEVLRRAWKRMCENPPDEFLDMIVRYVGRREGRIVTRNDVRALVGGKFPPSGKSEHVPLNPGIQRPATTRNDTRASVGSKYVPFGKSENAPANPDRQKPAITSRIVVTPTDVSGWEHKKIQWFTFAGRRQYAMHWKDMLKKVCTIASQENPSDFQERILLIAGKEREYFGTSDHGMTNPHLVLGTRVFIETNLSANNVKALVDKISFVFGYGPRVEVYAL